MQSDLVSIITPTYNSSKFIRETIASVKEQTYRSWEMIIVDDCSQDDTCSIIEDISSSDIRIKLFKNKKNEGPAIARNIGLGAAIGQYIAFLDSDDLWLPNKLESQLAFMKKHDIAFSYTLYRRISEQGDICGKLTKLPAKLTAQGMMKNTGIGGCLTVIIDKSKTGPFEMKDLRLHHDLLLWIEILRRGFTAFGLQEDLARYRIVNKSVSRNKIKSALGIWKLYRKELNTGFPKAIWYFVHYAVNAYAKSKTL